MNTILGDPGLPLPIIAAPMAGGPSTPELVVAAHRAGALGFLAGGYKTASDLAAQMAAVRGATSAFGVNLFAPHPVPVDVASYGRYRDAVSVVAERFGVDLPASPREDDDQWQDKVDVLLDHPVPLVSFTFGLPDRAAIAALHKAGSALVQTVTSAEEALRAAEAGLDILAVQASAAGGHSGTFTPENTPPDKPLAALLAEISHVTGLPKIAAGGLAGSDDIAVVIHGGAQAVMVGTALLLAPEAGTSAPYRQALRDAGRAGTVSTRAFTGRPARAIPNQFSETFSSQAPLGYPAVHHLTSPLRRAAAAAGQSGYLNLWAGTGHQRIREQPAENTLRELTADV